MSTTPRKPTAGQVRDAANEVIAALNAGRSAEAEAKIHAFLAMETDAFEIIDAVRQSAENLKRRDLEILLCRKGVATGYRFSTFSSRLAELLKETNQPALISDFIAGVDYATLGVFHFFTGFRFSGVERLAQALAEILKIPRVQLRVEAFENPQYLFPPMMANFAKTDCVSGHNLTATEPDIQMMQAFAVRPVVIRRNIFDALWAMYQYIEQTRKPYRGAFFGDVYGTFDRDKKLRALIHKFGQAYIEFHVSWERVVERKRLDVAYVDFGRLMTAPEAVLGEVLDFYGKSIDEKVIAAAARRHIPEAPADHPTLFRGRGRNALAKSHREALAAMAGYYPDIDFESIGMD